MAETKTNLRQAKAKAFVNGIVSEKDLKVVTDKGETRIEGNITVKTSDVNFIRFGVYAKEKTSNGTANKAYAGIQTVMNEYKSIADVGEEEATEVKVSGDVSAFTRDDGRVLVTYRSNFFNRVKAGDELDPKAEFSIEMFISSIAPEFTTDGEETGRLLVGGWVPTYNGIDPIELVAEGDVASAIDSGFEVGQTVEFYGEIINNQIRTVTEIPVKIGKPRQKVEVTYKNDLIIQGASEAYEEGITAELPYEADTIQIAIQEREARLAEEKAKKKSGQSEVAKPKPSGAAHGRTLGF